METLNILVALGEGVLKATRASGFLSHWSEWSRLILAQDAP